MRADPPHPESLAILDLGELERHRPHGSLEAWLDELNRSRVDALEVRAKELEGRDLLRLTERCRRAFHGLLLVNSRFDIALAAGADGVHLPAAGIEPERIRQHSGTSLCIGLSTHSTREIAAAAAAGVDYVTFGPVFPTPSKPGHSGVGLEALRQAVFEARLPVLALGGIGAAHIESIEATGAGVAAIRLFLDSDFLAQRRRCP